MPHGEGTMGTVDPSMEKFKPEIDEVGTAAKEGIESLEEDVLETQKKELREFSEKVEEDIKYLESIQEKVCTTEHGPNWIDIIAQQGNDAPAEA